MEVWLFSKHARIQMEARGISEAQVLRVLRGGGRKRISFGRCLRFLPPEQCRYSRRLRALVDIVAVVDEEDSVIVTVFREPGRVAPPPPEPRRQDRYFNRKAGRWVQRRLDTRFFP